jgi:hypothetical protein
MMQLNILPTDEHFKYTASYKSSPHEKDGRLYATSVTAQRLSKDFRHLLFHDHFEIDLTLAHLNLLLQDRKQEQQTLLSIHQVKRELEESLEYTTYAHTHTNPLKRIIYKI